METYKLMVNGQPKEVTADSGTPLLWVLREDLKMTGTKYGCGIASCGACTVHLAGVATRSCVVPVSLIDNRPILTIEGVGQDFVGPATLRECTGREQNRDQRQGLDQDSQRVRNSLHGRSASLKEKAPPKRGLK